MASARSRTASNASRLGRVFITIAVVALVAGCAAPEDDPHPLGPVEEAVEEPPPPAVAPDTGGWVTLRWTAGVRFRYKADEDKCLDREVKKEREFTVPLAPEAVYPATLGDGKDPQTAWVSDFDLGQGYTLTMLLYSVNAVHGGQRINPSAEIFGNWGHAFAGVTSDESITHLERVPIELGDENRKTRQHVLSNAHADDADGRGFEYQAFSVLEVVERIPATTTPAPEALVPEPYAPARRRIGARAPQTLRGPGDLAGA